MKTRSLWLLALLLGTLCLWMTYSFWEKSRVKSIIGVQSGAVVLSRTPLPVLHWGSLNKFGDLALQLKNDNFIDLATIPLAETVRFNGLTYTQVQPGLWLVMLDRERIFIFTDPFDPGILEPNVALSFNSDWVVLQRSSLLPKNWPEPEQGWVVLGPSLSNQLKTWSLDTQKPVVKPQSEGTVWLEKTPETDWRVISP